MARTFNSISAFVAFMEAKIATLPEAQKHGLEKAAAHIEEQAKAVIGTYDYNWPQLADATQDDRTRKGFTPNDPLLRTGELKESIQHKVVDHAHAAVGSDDDKAVWNELGTDKAPPRSFLGETGARHGKEAAHLIGEAVHAHLAGRG